MGYFGLVKESWVETYMRRLVIIDNHPLGKGFRGIGSDCKDRRGKRSAVGSHSPCHGTPTPPLRPILVSTVVCSCQQMVGMGHQGLWREGVFGPKGNGWGVMMS